MKIVLTLVLMVVAAWLLLFASPYSVLVRDDPMAVSESNPPVLKDSACVYFTGWETRTVYLHNGLRCERFVRL
jgi:hypothetical protein